MPEPYEYVYAFLDTVADAIRQRQLAPGIDYDVTNNNRGHYLYIQMQSPRIDRCKPDANVVPFKALTQWLGQENFATTSITRPTSGYLRKPDGNIWTSRKATRGWTCISIDHPDCPRNLKRACRDYPTHQQQYLQGGSSNA
jgi:hypothetical protein